jgi:ribosomal-protein-alanine N-acetyltransferase
MAEIHAAGFAIGWNRADLEGMMLSGDVADVQVSRAWIGDIVTGFAVSRIGGGEAELLSIALDPETRGKGQARALLEFHLQNVRRAGANTLFLEVSEDNDPALHLYRRLGFEAMGRRKGYYGAKCGRRTDAITMRRDLSALDPTPRYF